MKKTIFVAGNPLVEEDSLALEIVEKLEGKLAGIKFKELNSLGELETIPDDLYIIDVAKGIEKIEVLRDLNKLDSIKLVSAHDLDLGTELLLYRKLGKLGNVCIFAVPLGCELEKAVSEMAGLLEKEFG